MRKIICICFAFVISGIASSQTSKQSFPKGVKQANKGIKTKSRKDNKEKICLFSKRMDFAPISSDYKLFSNGISNKSLVKLITIFKQIILYKIDCLFMMTILFQLLGR